MTNFQLQSTSKRLPKHIHPSNWLSYKILQLPNSQHCTYLSDPSKTWRAWLHHAPVSWNRPYCPWKQWKQKPRQQPSQRQDLNNSGIQSQGVHSPCPPDASSNSDRWEHSHQKYLLTQPVKQAQKTIIGTHPIPYSTPHNKILVHQPNFFSQTTQLQLHHPHLSTTPPIPKIARCNKRVTLSTI